MSNPLFDDQTVDFLLNNVWDLPGIVGLSHYQHVEKDTLQMSLDTARRFSREKLFPTLRATDQQPPELHGGRIKTHPVLGPLYREMADAGYVAMAHMQMPQLLQLAINAYLSAGNLGASCYVGLTTGAAALIEHFGSADLKQRYLEPMHDGRFTGTMALTEPHAGSSLGDIRTKAVPTGNGDYLIEGEKVFISGGDNSFSENVVHLTLARIEGAPAGTRGVSLFAIPRVRADGTPNDVVASGLFHKMGWKALPSIALKFGDEGKCRGELVGRPNEGLKHMFLMMNGARLSVGLAATASASLAYQEALAYAKTRPQGRAMSNRDATTPQVPIIEHADVRRMLLAQKAIVEGSLSLLFACGRYWDLSLAAPSEEERSRAGRLLDLLTPLAKTIPSERGFEACALSVQVHGGYGYTSEYLPELALREQKLNTLHEGTTGIQSLDLLGRKIFGDAGATAMELMQDMREDLEAARKVPALAAHAEAFEAACNRWGSVIMTLGGRAQGGQIEQALATSVWHLELAGIIVLAWQWLRMAHKAQGTGLAAGKQAACDYWFQAEVSRLDSLAERVLVESPAYLAVAAVSL